MSLLFSISILLSADTPGGKPDPLNTGTSVKSEDGELVWLVAIGDENDRWWRPDGTRMETPPVLDAVPETDFSAVSTVVGINGAPLQKPAPVPHQRRFVLASTVGSDARVSLREGALEELGFRVENHGSSAVYSPDGKEHRHGAIAIAKFGERPDVETLDLAVTVRQRSFERIGTVHYGEQQSITYLDGPVVASVSTESEVNEMGQRTSTFRVERVDGSPLRDEIFIFAPSPPGRDVVSSGMEQLEGQVRTITRTLADDAPSDVRWIIMHLKKDPAVFKGVHLFPNDDAAEEPETGDAD